MKHNRKIIYLAGFLFSLSIALVSYINSSFISSFVGEKFAGIVYVLGSMGSLFSLFIAPIIFKKIGGYKFLLSVILLDALSFLVLSLTENTLVAIAIFVLGFSMNTLIIFTLDEILEIFSKNSSTGKIRGVYLMLCNSAWIFAQLLSGEIIGESSYRTIYLSSFSVMLVLFLVSFLKLKDIPDPRYDQIRSFKYIADFFKDKNLSRAYILSFLLQFFFAWMVIYTPIYLYAHLGFSWQEIGIIFAIMLTPFVLIQFPLGKYADKNGERNMLLLGFSIISVFTLSIFFVEQKIFWLWALLLFATRIGAASVEVMCDSYFFKNIEPENEALVGVYRSASPFAYILAPFLAFIVFTFTPSFGFIFLILGILMTLGIYFSSQIKP